MLTLVASLTHYFEAGFFGHYLLPETMTGIVLLLAFAILTALELHSPQIERPRRQSAQSYQTNLGMLAFNSVMMSVLSVTSLLIFLDHFSGGGLLGSLSSPALKAVLSFLLLDLFLYGWHRVCHSFDSLWMFHKVHHNDPCLNVSTAFRIHLVELVMTGILKSLCIILLGIDKRVVLAYETVYTLCVMIHHSNISFPGERLLGHLVITPDLHRAHHSREREEHDSNYGAVFSVWDRLLRTLKAVKPRAVGLKGESPQTLPELIHFGFKKYWPAATESAKGIGANIHAMIAEAAYYKAEKRAFSPGFELYDWLEAKKEVCRQVYGDNCANC
ncbi:MAG: sterol desaturase family protein [Gammaproteobacteria bacterium]